MWRSGGDKPPPAGAAKRSKASSVRSCCGLLAAKLWLCAMNVGSFALAAGLVAVGAKKARPRRWAQRREPPASATLRAS